MTTRVPRGRQTIIQDTNIRREVEALWAAIQEVKLRAAQIDADDVAPAIGSAMRTGQLEVLNDVLEGAEPFSKVRVGSSNGAKILAIERGSSDVSGQNVPANGTLDVTFSGLTSFLLFSNDDVAVTGSMNPLPSSLSTTTYAGLTLPTMQIRNHTGSIVTIPASTTAVVTVFYFED